MNPHLHCFLSPSDIQEFYEVTLLDSQRWAESSKTPDAVTAVTLWDFSSLQSTAVTSDTLPSLSTSIEVKTARRVTSLPPPVRKRRSGSERYPQRPPDAVLITRSEPDYKVLQE